MLPLLPLAAAVSSSAMLIHRKRKKEAEIKAQKEANDKIQKELLEFAHNEGVPFDSEGNFNPDELVDGVPLLFKTMDDKDLMSSLLEYGANPNISNADGVPALHHAMSNSKYHELVPILLDNGANPNICNLEGVPALHYATANHPMFISTLLSYGAVPDSVDADGKTVIFYVNSNLSSKIQMFKNLGVDINAVDKDGKSVLFYAISKKTTQFYLELGVNINIKDNEGKSILFYITSPDDFPLIKTLESKGLDINAVDNTGQNFKLFKKYINYKKYLSGSKELYYAVSKNDIDEAKKLLENGANKDTRDKTIYGWNMIHLAIHKKNIEMVETLVKCGIDINCHDDIYSPLEKAIFDNNEKMVEKLLELGADPTLANDAVKYKATDNIKEIFKKYHATHFSETSPLNPKI